MRRDLWLIVLIREDLSLTNRRCNYKGSTFYSVILRPWLLVRSGLNSRPPAWQPAAQPTELAVLYYKVKFESNLKQSDSTFYHLGKLLSVVSKRLKSVVVVFFLTLFCVNWKEIHRSTGDPTWSDGGVRGSRVSFFGSPRTMNRSCSNSS